MRRISRSWLALASVVLVAGCDTALDEARDALRSRHREWTRLGIDDYSFVIQQHCFCPEELLQPSRVTVRDGQVSSVVVVASGTPVSNLSFFPTIDDLFTRLESFTESRGATLNLNFDARYHFPSDASGDIKNAQDAAFVIRVMEFQAL